MVAPTAKPVEGSGAFGNSVRVWLGCVAFLVVVELYIVLIGGGLEKDPRIGLFAPLSIAAFGIAGLVGIWFSHRTGFPAAWDSRVTNRHRLVYPIIWGIGLGVAFVAHDLVFHWTAAYKEIIGAPSTAVARSSSKSSTGCSRSRSSSGSCRTSLCAVGTGRRSSGCWQPSHR